MRLSLTVFGAALVCASACGGALPNTGPSGARGGSGGSGGSANGATGGTTSGGAGATIIIGTGGGTWKSGVGGAGGVGLGGGQPCASAAACACDSQAAECQPVLMSVCLGAHCPPSLDDAMLVANWTLGSASGPAAGRAHGDYSECPDGSRGFMFQQSGAGYTFGFDASGRLAAWSTFDGGACGQLVCGGDTPAPSLCSVCEMFSDPQPAGSFLVPRGISNGPLPNCEIDANGRWFMPLLAPAN